MSFLKNLFRRHSLSGSAPAIGLTAAAPVPQGEWNVIVDRAGFPVTSRQPAPGDMLARHAVPYIYGGTIPGHVPDRYSADQERINASMDHRLRDARNAAFLERAVFLLSQTDDGRRLLHKAKANGFRFIFDHEKVENEGAVGLCDYKNKCIPLAEGRSAEEVALTLKHELEHMENISHGLSTSIKSTLQEQIAVDRLLEGNARVSESVTAAQAYLGSPNGPPDQFRTGSLFAALWQKTPEMASAALHAFDLARAGNWKNFAERVLPAYYTMKPTLSYYDSRLINHNSRTIPDISDALQCLQDRYRQPYEHRDAERHIAQSRQIVGPLLKDDTWTPDKIAETVTICGIPYLSAAGAHDCTDQNRTALMAGAVNDYNKLAERVRLIDPEKANSLTISINQDLSRNPLQQNPFAAHAGTTSAPKTDFEPIRLPGRMDGARLANGRADNDMLTQKMAGEMSAMKSGNTDTDKLNFIIDGHINKNGNTIVSDLISAGLRAPIGAFPEGYLQDLCRRMKFDAQIESNAGIQNYSVKDEELLLIQHWRDMASHGLDPVWIDKANRDASIISEFQEINFWANHILNAIKTDSSQPGTSSRPALAL